MSNQLIWYKKTVRKSPKSESMLQKAYVNM